MICEKYCVFEAEALTREAPLLICSHEMKDKWFSVLFICDTIEESVY